MSGFILFDQPTVQYKYTTRDGERKSSWSIDQFGNQTARIEATHQAIIDTGFALCLPSKSEELSIKQLLRYASVTAFFNIVNGWCLDYLEKNSNFGILRSYSYIHELTLFRRIPFLNSLEVNLAQLEPIGRLKRPNLTDIDTLKSVEKPSGFYFNGTFLTPGALLSNNAQVLDRFSHLVNPLESKQGS